MSAPKFGENESGFNIAVRKDERFTITLTAIPQAPAIKVTKDFWGIMPGSIARMLRLEGPLDARGGF